MVGNDKQYQRIILSVVIVAAVAVFLGIFKLKSDLSAPFTLWHNREAQKAADIKASRLGLNETESLNDLFDDTDGDGLNDFEELNIYNTSPYLDDSDSDGVSDGMEVEKGTDPNCPEGQNCGAITTPTTDQEKLTVTSVEKDVEPFFGGFDLNALSASGLSETGFNGETGVGLNGNGLIGQPNPDELREQLIAAGMSAEVLAEIDDAMLLEVYQQTLGEYQTANSRF